MRTIILGLLLLLGLWIVASRVSDELASMAEVRRLEAAADLAQAQAHRDEAAALRIQAETAKITAQTIKAQASSIMALAALLIVWSAVIAAGGVVVALVAIKRRASAALPATSWPVSYPVELVEGSYHERR